MIKNLESGKFYWVLILRDGEEKWEPARFTGYSGDSNGEATWDFIGIDSAVGHHHITVLRVGIPVGDAA